MKEIKQNKASGIDNNRIDNETNHHSLYQLYQQQFNNLIYSSRDTLKNTAVFERVLVIKWKVGYNYLHCLLIKIKELDHNIAFSRVFFFFF